MIRTARHGRHLREERREIGEGPGERGLRARTFPVEPDGAALAQITELIDGGLIASEAEEVFPLDEAAAAHERLGGGRAKGEIVLRVAP